MKRFRKIYVEITNICNLSCSFCHKTARPPQFMEPAAFERLLREARPYTDYLYLHLMGEPLLHPRLAKLFSLCADAGMRVNLTTNGTRIADVKEILLSASALRKVGFSLHSYEANRMEIPLEQYLGDIFAFAREASRAGIISELRLWNSDARGRVGGNRMNEAIFRSIAREFGDFTGRGPDRRGGVRLADRVYLGLAPVFDWPDAGGQELGASAFCHGLRDQLGVLVDGTVVPCCLDSEGTIALGNLFDKPLAEILDGPRAKALYDGFSRREAVEPLCRRCGYARKF